MQIELLDCGPRSLLCSWTLSNLMICYWDELSPNSCFFSSHPKANRLFYGTLTDPERATFSLYPSCWLILTLMIIKINYCCSVLDCISRHPLSRLQSVLNATARLILSTRRSDPTTAMLHELHWLRIPEQIQFWLYVLSYRCLRRTAPLYLTADIFCQCTLFRSNNDDNNNCDIALLRFLQLDMYIVLSAWICNFQLHFHSSSLESLHEHFDVDILPEELGGKLPATDELVKVKSWFSKFWYIPTLHASPCLFVCLFCHNSIG